MEHKHHYDLPVVLVSKDTNLRIKADALGLVAEDYETDKIDIDELYTGTVEVMTSAENMTLLFSEGHLRLETTLYPNQAITLRG